MIHARPQYTMQLVLLHQQPFAAKLQLIHMDVCGPMQVSSAGEANTWLPSLVTTQKSLMVQLKFKSEVAGKVKETIALLEYQTNKRIKSVLPDKGREYVNSELQFYFKGKGP